FPNPHLWQPHAQGASHQKRRPMLTGTIREFVPLVWMSCHRASTNAANPGNCRRTPAPTLMPNALRVTSAGPENPVLDAIGGSSIARTLYSPTPPIRYGWIIGSGSSVYVASNVPARMRGLSELLPFEPNWCHAPSRRNPIGTTGNLSSRNAPACQPDDVTSDRSPDGDVIPPTTPNPSGLEICACATDAAPVSNSPTRNAPPDHDRLICTLPI